MAKGKQPIQKGIAKVPVVIQLEALECGAACLTMIMAYYNKWIPLEQVRSDCGVSRDGVNGKNVLVAARSYGMTAKGYRYETETLRKKGVFPCVVHWNFSHFVVLRGFRGKYAYLNDPARGELKIRIEEFDQAFTGICMFITPGDSFSPGGSRKSTLAFAKKRLAGAGAAVAFMATVMALACLFGILNPVFSRFFMDQLLTGAGRDQLLPFILLLAAVSMVQVIVLALQSIYMLKINGKMAVIGSTSFMWKVLKMPMEFFSQRMAGDIQQRKTTNAQIAFVIINTLAPLALNIVMMIFYLVVMIRFSPVLTLVGVISILINVILAQWISGKRVNITRVQMRDSAKLASYTVSGIRMIETIKSAGAENGFFRKWSGYQAAVNTADVKYARLNVLFGLLPSFLANLANYVVLVIGVFLIMRGHFTLGCVMSFQSFLILFMTPAMTLVSASQTIQEMRTQMERVEDVMEYPADEFAKDTPLKEDVEYCKLKGEVELKNVTFGYSRLGKPLITGFSMHMEPGSCIAFVGRSGCGKSTLSKLITGLYAPWEGEILFDGKPASEIHRDVFTGSVAVVDQDIILFEETISNNIRMWDTSIEDFDVLLAARDAQIHDGILARKGGYHGKITEGGKDLSGGQKQRLEIARVLAQDPSILILDEATSALDARTEHDLVKSVRERGITCIVIAHRLSTIRDCDEIIVLDKGIIVERGTHEELYAKGGVYTELVSND